MGMRVYELPSSAKAPLEAYLQTDPISRLSITLRDARFFGEDKSLVYLFLEGDERVLAETREPLEKLGAKSAPEGEKLAAKLKEAEDEAAGGVGFLFG